MHAEQRHSPDRPARLSESDRRLEARFTLPSPAESAGQDPAAMMRLVDVSVHGCRIKNPGNVLKPGQFVGIQLEGLCRISGIVRWHRGNTAGIEFTRAVSDDVIAAIRAHKTTASARLL